MPPRIPKNYFKATNDPFMTTYDSFRRSDNVEDQRKGAVPGGGHWDYTEVNSRASSPFDSDIARTITESERPKARLADRMDPKRLEYPISKRPPMNHPGYNTQKPGTIEHQLEGYDILQNSQEIAQRKNSPTQKQTPKDLMTNTDYDEALREMSYKVPKK